MQFRNHTFPNGLQVVAEVDDAALSVSLGYFVKAGARHESAELSGVSHFLEHMQFKGTQRRTAEQVNREIDELGGNSNAYTSEDHTVYYMHVIPEYQSQSVDLLTDLMRPSLRDEDFETERKVILEEIAMYDDQPPYGALELSMEQYFGSHPLANRILGTNESVGALTSTGMRNYHRQRYAADHLCFVATGAVDFDELVRQLEKLTSDWEPSKAPEITPALAAPERLFVEQVVAIANQQYVVKLQSAPHRKSSDRFAYRMASSAIGDDGGSRLFWALIDTGLAESAGLFTQHFDDTGIVATILACPPEDAEENWTICREVVLGVEKNPLSQRELELVRNRICSSIILAAERPSNRLFSIGNNWIFRQLYEPLTKTLENYASVSLDQFNEAAASLATGQGTITAVGPTAGLRFC